MLRKLNKSMGWNRLPMGVMVELVLTTPDSGVLCPWIMFILYRIVSYESSKLTKN